MDMNELILYGAEDIEWATTQNIESHRYTVDQLRSGGRTMTQLSVIPCVTLSRSAYAVMITGEVADGRVCARLFTKSISLLVVQVLG